MSDSGRGGVREFITTCGGLGYGPGMPGTFGTLSAAAAYAIIEGLRCRLGFAPLISTLALAALGIVCTAAGIALGRWAEEHFGRKDPQCFVLDEAAGFLTTAFLLPVLFPDAALWLVLLVAFATARAFDIVKLPPVRHIERLPHGWGIVLDDVASGVYSAVASCGILAALERSL